MKSTILSTLLILFVATFNNVAEARGSVSLMRRALQSTGMGGGCGSGSHSSGTSVRNKEIKMDTSCCCISVVAADADADADANAVMDGEGSAVGA
jgi:hypothetical protein